MTDLNFRSVIEDRNSRIISISWGENLQVFTEINVGYRFVDTPRKLDIVIRNADNNRFLGTECKKQSSAGSSYEKIAYAIQNCKKSPIPTIVVFTGDQIKPDMKVSLFSSGVGLEVKLVKNSANQYEVKDNKNMLRQRIYSELGLNWIPFATGDRIEEQIRQLGITLPD